jgi:hypothetical protein
MSLHGLWSVFGPETSAGKQLRSLLGNPTIDKSPEIKYPTLRSRSVHVPKTVEKRTAHIQYPRFEKHMIKSTPPKPVRRPLQAIRASASIEKTHPRESQPPLKNMAEEKKKLQEAFQFNSKKSLENAETRVSSSSFNLPTVIDAHNIPRISACSNIQP